MIMSKDEEDTRRRRLKTRVVVHDDEGEWSGEEIVTVDATPVENGRGEAQRDATKRD